MLCVCCVALSPSQVNKKVGQEYQLFWKESPDFVRLAARCGAIIVPFAAVGADDAYDGEAAREGGRGAKDTRGGCHAFTAGLDM